MSTSASGIRFVRDCRTSRRNFQVRCLKAEFSEDMNSRMLKLPACRKDANVGGNSGELAEWLRSGLQIRVHRFESGTRLHLPFPLAVAGREMLPDAVRATPDAPAESQGGSCPQP